MTSPMSEHVYWTTISDPLPWSQLAESYVVHWVYQSDQSRQAKNWV